MYNSAAFLVIAVVAQLAAVPIARADVDLPKKTTATKVSLVRAYAPCVTPNDTHTTGAVIAACSPAAALSSYSFGSTGKGSAQVQIAGYALKLRFDVTDVRTAGDDPADGVAFSGRAHVRFTDDGCSGTTCTVETFFSVTLSCEGGRCSGKSTYPEVLLPFRAPVSAEITGIDVYDDLGNRFATMGIATQ
jgi:hypothetical protein